MHDLWDNYIQNSVKTMHELWDNCLPNYHLRRQITGFKGRAITNVERICGPNQLLFVAI